MKKRLFRGGLKGGLTALLIMAMVTCAVIGAYMWVKTQQAGVTILPTGDLVVTPTSFNLGEMHLSTSVNQTFTFDNQTECALNVTWSSTITDNGSIVLNVDTALSGFSLPAGNSVQKNVVFTAPADAPYGVHVALDWDVTATTP